MTSQNTARASIQPSDSQMHLDSEGHSPLKITSPSLKGLIHPDNITPANKTLKMKSPS